MAYLRREHRYSQAPRPDLILLDLDMPRRNGREVLTAVKADEQLCTIPVVVFTTSDIDSDVLGSYSARQRLRHQTPRPGAVRTDHHLHPRLLRRPRDAPTDRVAPWRLRRSAAPMQARTVT